jgi:hypothetical protein
MDIASIRIVEATSLMGISTRDSRSIHCNGVDALFVSVMAGGSARLELGLPSEAATLIEGKGRPPAGIQRHKRGDRQASVGCFNSRELVMITAASAGIDPFRGRC